MSKKVVVLGASGFIGSYVVEKLIENKYEVIAADIKHTKYISKKNFVKCDILVEKEVSDLITPDVSFVYNFAGLANLDVSVEYPKKTMELNVIGNINILNACREAKVNRIIYASSAYALSDKGSFYGISKLSSEKIVEEYYKRYGLEFTIVRYGSVYGERDFDNNYIYNLIKSAVQTGEINHNGDGEEIREYIHVKDVAKLSVDIIESDNFKNENVILTGVERMKRKALFGMINEILGNSLTIRLNGDGYNHHYKTTPYAFHPAVAKKLIANPHIDMGQGLLECIKDVHENKK